MTEPNKEPEHEPTVTVNLEPEPRTFSETMTPEIGSLAGALSAAQGAMENGTKDKQGYGYKYMTLSNLTDIARKPLADNDIAILQTHEFVRGTTNHSVVTHTTVMHESGEWFKSSLELPIHQMNQLSAAQMIGVCCTYGRRYALQAICMIAAEEDTDANTQ